MTSATPSAEPRHIAPPVLRDGRLCCPRCGARLQFDREEYVCLICGYEYLPDDQALVAFPGSSRPRQAAAAIAAVVLSIDGLAVLGVVALAALLLGSSLGRRRAGRRGHAP